MEYKTFNEYRNTLKIGIAAGALSVADLARARNLIDDDAYEEVLAARTNKHKARLLLQYVGDQIQVLPDQLQVFIQILKEESAHDYLAIQLEKNLAFNKKGDAHQRREQQGGAGVDVTDLPSPPTAPPQLKDQGQKSKAQ